MPPTPDAVRGCWAYARKQFPNAQIKASTLDTFALKLWAIRDRLPVVEQEIGNAWLTQMATNPFRLRALRHIARIRKAYGKSENTRKSQMKANRFRFSKWRQKLILRCEGAKVQHFILFSNTRLEPE